MEHVHRNNTGRTIKDARGHRIAPNELFSHVNGRTLCKSCHSLPSQVEDHHHHNDDDDDSLGIGLATGLSLGLGSLMDDDSSSGSGFDIGGGDFGGGDFGGGGGGGDC